jgi:hypothetical protein
MPRKPTKAQQLEAWNTQLAEANQQLETQVGTLAAQVDGLFSLLQTFGMQ